MRLNESEVKTLRDLLLSQMRKAERVGMNSKLAVYRARIDVIDKVLGSAGVELLDEVERVNLRI